MNKQRLLILILSLVLAPLLVTLTHARDQGGGKGARKGAGKKLPVLTEGKGKGCHAYYEGDSYIAKVHDSGALELTLKDAGQASVPGSVPLNKKKMWSIDIVPGLRDTKMKKSARHPVTEFTEHSPPSDQATKVKIVSKRTTGIIFETIYEFSPETITTWYRAEAGQETPKDRIYYLAHKINRIECGEKERKKSKYELKSYSGKKIKYDFLESAKVSSKDSENINIEGPFWGKREISFERGSDEEATMKPVKYSDVTLRNGSSIWLIKTDSASNKHDQEKITITIE